MNKIVNGVANDYEFNDIGYYQEINIPARQIGKTYQVINMYEQKYKKLQSNWNSLREYIKNKDNWYYDIDCSGDKRYIFININDVLDKMNELEGSDSNNNLEKQKDNKKVHFTIDWDEDIIGYEDTMHNGI